MDQETSRRFSWSASSRLLKQIDLTQQNEPLRADKLTQTFVPQHTLEHSIGNSHRLDVSGGLERYNVVNGTTDACESASSGRKRGKKSPSTSPVFVSVKCGSNGSKQVANESSSELNRLPLSLSSSALTKASPSLDSTAPVKDIPIKRSKKYASSSLREELDPRRLGQDPPPKHKFIVSYFRETYRGNSYDWRTKFVDHIDIDMDADEDLESEYGESNDEDAAGIARVRLDENQSIAREQENKRVVVAIRPQQIGDSSSSSGHTSATSQTVIDSKISSNNLPKENSSVTDTTRRKSSVIWNTNDEFSIENTTTEPSSRSHSKDRRQTRHLFDYMPSFSTTMSTSGGRRSSAFSEGFDVGSGTSRIKFASEGSNGTQLCRRRRRTGSSSSFRNLKLIVKRNLVATLIGAYILFSIIFMIALMVPYIYRVVNNKNTTTKSTLIDDVTLTSQTSYLIDEIELKSLSKAISERNKLRQSDEHSKNELSASLIDGQSELSSQSGGADGVGDKIKHSIRSPGSSLTSQSGVTTSTSSRTGTSDMRSKLTHKVSVGTQTDSFQSDHATGPISGVGINGDASEPDNSDNGTTNITLSTMTMMRSDDLASTRNSSNPRRPPKSLAELWDIRLDRECEPIKIPFCTHSLELSSSEHGASSHKVKFPYSSTLMPNRQNSIQQSQIETTLEKYAPLVDVRCYALMPLFLCSIHVPKCIQVDRNSTTSSTSSNNQSGNLAEPMIPETKSPPPSPMMMMMMMMNKKGGLNSNAARAIDTSLPSSTNTNLTLDGVATSSYNDAINEDPSSSLAASDRETSSGSSGGKSRIAAFLASTMPKLSPSRKMTSMRSKEPPTARLVPPCRSVCKGRYRLSDHLHFHLQSLPATLRMHID